MKEGKWKGDEKGEQMSHIYRLQVRMEEVAPRRTHQTTVQRAGVGNGEEMSSEVRRMRGSGGGVAHE